MDASNETIQQASEWAGKCERWRTLESRRAQCPCQPCLNFTRYVVELNKAEMRGRQVDGDLVATLQQDVTLWKKLFDDTERDITAATTRANLAEAEVATLQQTIVARGRR